MKLNTAFKLSALAVALASTSVFASTLDVSKLDVIWDNARDLAPSSADRELDVNGQLKYQYVDVGSEGTNTKAPKETVLQNQLTELFKEDGASNFVLKISPVGSDTETQAKYYTFEDSKLVSEVLAALGKTDLSEVDAEEIANLFKTDKGGALLGSATLPYQFTKLKEYEGTATSTLIMAGTSRDFAQSERKVNDIKRLDSKWLEYADSTKDTRTFISNEGNLTNDDKTSSLVLANITDDEPLKVDTLKSDRGVLTGILNTNPVVQPDGIVSYPSITDREYGVLVHATKEELNLDGKSLDQLTASQVKALDFKKTIDSSKITETQIVVSSIESTYGSKPGTSTIPDPTTGLPIEFETKELDESKLLSQESYQTVITSKGITTGSLTVNGVDVGQALGNAAILGDLSDEDIQNLVNSGETLSTIQKDVVALDTKVDNEVARLDGRIDAELTANAQASTIYTDKKATETLVAADTAAKAEDVKTLTAAQDFAKAEDAKTLAAAKTSADAGDAATLSAANSYTDAQVSNFTGRVTQLNNRIDDVEKTAYRGIAIALAAQQQVPNIGAGQFAVFGGVGHYEGETAGALGVASVFADGRTSVSAALGVAGGSEVGGRVGVAYVFGGK